MMTEGEREATRTAAKALDKLIEYDVRVMGTCRTEVWDGHMQALDIEDLTQQLRKKRYRQPEGDDAEDCIAYVTLEEDGWGGDETEIDLRPDGEPFAWDCIDIVKRLAKLADGTILDQRAEIALLILEASTRCRRT